MFIEAVTVSINFSDYLARCIKRNAGLLDRWIIVTGARDVATRRLCEPFPNVEVVLTRVPYRMGVNFPKARMINEGFARLYRKDWVLHLDSDILLPKKMRSFLRKSRLDPDCLYGPEFRWVLDQRGKRVAADRFNSDRILGYFQLFHSSRLVKYPQRSSNASYDDWIFNERWSARKRIKLAGLTAGHFGPCWTYWLGRAPVRSSRRSPRASR